MHFNNYSIEEAANILQMEEDRLRTALRNAIGKLKILPR
jgi:DNA-directed RNA polymerase specialized sigma24 family protein